jgi:NAD(P)-dependent dehydrogenase (short-subunit alcohol dehydrogenase family)
MEQQFSGKLVAITGVGRAGQVGEILALRLAQSGARLVLIDREKDAVEERAADLQRAGHRAVAVVADLTNADDVARTAAECTDNGKTAVHALVAAAGGFAMSGPVAESDFAAWQHQLQISLITAYLSTRAFLPALRAARGSIVYFASAAALPGGKAAKMSAYAVAKAGVIALMHAVSQEAWGNGVLANALAPTSIRTAANVSAMGGNQAYVDRESVADVVHWLCSDASRDVTGQVIRLGA